MNKVTIVLLLGLVLLAIQSWAQVPGLCNLGYVVVSPNGPTDGGDFGPGTPGTQTSGIQEAFNYAKANKKEVYIIGGGVADPNTPPVVYDIHTTLTIPWGQDWHMDGGNYIMNFTQTSGDCLVIDSQMNSQFNLGTISAPNLQTGTLVKVAPTSVGPDDFKVITCTIIKISSIVGNGNGTGLHVTAASGILTFNPIFVGEIADCDTGILIDGGTHCTITSPIVRKCNTHLQVNSGEYHKIDVMMNPNDLTGPVVGAKLNGNENICILAWQGNFDPGNALVFESNAKDNLVYVMGLPVDGVTNSATTPNNRVVPLKPIGFAITTPSVPPSDDYKVNDTPYSVVVTILTPGTVSNWIVADSTGATTGTVSGGFFAGQSIYLEPGDKVRFSYTSPPTWKWRALR